MFNPYRDFGSVTNPYTADEYFPEWELHTSYRNDIRLVRNEKNEGTGLFALIKDVLFNN